MKQFSLSDQCTLLRYDLRRNRKDVMGVMHLYKTSPADGSGPVNFFDSEEDLRRWIEQVKEIRQMQGEGVLLLDLLSQS